MDRLGEEVTQIPEPIMHKRNRHMFAEWKATLLEHTGAVLTGIRMIWSPGQLCKETHHREEYRLGLPKPSRRGKHPLDDALRTARPEHRSSAVLGSHLSQ